MSSRFRLIVRSDFDQEREVPMDPAGVTIGRHASNTVCLEDADVSRFHARMTPVADGVMLLDRESYAGTWLDDRLVREPRLLRHGEGVRIGRYEVFVAEEGLTFDLPTRRIPSEDDQDDDDLEGEIEIGDASRGPRRGDATPAFGSSGVVANVVERSPEVSLPLPAFRITASREALDKAMAGDRGRRHAERGVRLIFLAPEPSRDPARMTDGPLRIGSDPACEAAIEADGVLPLHATLARESGELVLTASAGATFEVAGAAHAKRVIVPGEQVRLGAASIMLANCLRPDAPTRGPYRSSSASSSRVNHVGRWWRASLGVVAACLIGLVIVLRPPPPSPRPRVVPVQLAVEQRAAPVNVPPERVTGPPRFDAARAS
ncbi:MAG: FHA domain-containing protein, partial [Deltaproteobacteria bacterium]